jgi:tRNA dimethylallyltransferase
MESLLLILGPTAVGKTSFALKLADQALELGFTGVDLISADSRQVYRGLEVLSGADVPEGFVSIENQDFFEKNTTHLHGVSILDLTEEWSVAHFKNFAIKIIKSSFANNRLPIIVGGTNLYIKHLFNTDENLYVQPIDEVREKAKNMPVKELQDWLETINPKKLSEMNNSDINNPRRLVRAIEISLGKPEVGKVLNLPKEIKTIKIGLSADSDKDVNLKKILQRIEKRVSKRFENGAILEVEKLHEICSDGGQSLSTDQDLTVCSTLGANDISSYLRKEIDQKKCLENWSLHEFQYAKRQLVWLKKELEVIWLDDSTKSSYTLDSKLFRK